MTRRQDLLPPPQHQQHREQQQYQEEVGFLDIFLALMLGEAYKNVSRIKNLVG